MGQTVKLKPPILKHAMPYAKITVTRRPPGVLFVSVVVRLVRGKSIQDFYAHSVASPQR